MRWIYILAFLFFAWAPYTLFAQIDSIPEKSRDSFFLMRYKGLLGRLAKNIMVEDRPQQAEIQRNEQKFLAFEGRPIRNIIIQPVEFGTPIADTTKKLSTTLINISNRLHRQSRVYVLKRNLFFSEKDELIPFLLADNERHLRDLPYIGDARILVRAVPGQRDSVDVFVVTKDVLPYGGSFNFSSFSRMEGVARNDNFFGWGDRLQLRGVFDADRKKSFGYGAEYISRNIGGSFIDGTLGFNTAGPTMNTARKEELTVYTSLIKPLVHPYMRWTYAFDAGYHQTANMYISDSLYRSDFQYRYANLDAWMAYNMKISIDADKAGDQRLRTLLGLRFLQQKFNQIPARYEGSYYFRYTDMIAALASLSIFRQDFYKAQYIYGFGRTEDVPEGLDVSITTGWTEKQGRPRGYAGLDIQLNYFNKNEHYFDYTLRVGGFTKDQKYEDLDLFLNFNYFTNLRKLGRWRQRSFLTANLSSQFNTMINEPLFLQSRFALPEYRGDSLIGGTFRATVHFESVFYSDWSLASFRFAPFTFARGTYLNHDLPLDRNFFSSIGAGIRTRNESLIFGTLEFKAFYFPGANFRKEFFRFEFATNLRFRYNSSVLRKPDFLIIN